MLKEGHLAGKGKGSGIPPSPSFQVEGNPQTNFHSPRRHARATAGSHTAPLLRSFPQAAGQQKSGVPPPTHLFPCSPLFPGLLIPGWWK